jgi:hypothetical protein
MIRCIIHELFPFATVGCNLVKDESSTHTPTSAPTKLDNRWDSSSFLSCLWISDCVIDILAPQDMVLFERKEGYWMDCVYGSTAFMIIGTVVSLKLSE